MKSLVFREKVKTCVAKKAFLLHESPTYSPGECYVEIKNLSFLSLTKVACP